MSQLGPRISGTKQSTGADRPEFADGELSDDGTGTTVIPMTLRTHRATYLGRFSTRRVMTALMAARRTRVDGEPPELIETAQIWVSPSFDTLLRF